MTCEQFNDLLRALVSQELILLAILQRIDTQLPTRASNREVSAEIAAQVQRLQDIGAPEQGQGGNIREVLVEISNILRTTLLKHSGSAKYIDFVTPRGDNGDAER